MTEITIHLDSGAHPIDIHFDGGQGTPIAAFVLLTAVPVEPMASHIICFGNSDTVGRLLISMWRNSVEKDPSGAWVIEQAARDIIDAADSHRKGWPGESVTGNA